jgi:hypothetical protein
MSNPDTDVSPTLGTDTMKRDDIVTACRQWDGTINVNEEQPTYEVVDVAFGLADYSPTIRDKTTQLVIGTDWEVFHPRDTLEPEHYQDGLVRFERPTDDA